MYIIYLKMIIICDIVTQFTNSRNAVVISLFFFFYKLNVVSTKFHVTFCSYLKIIIMLQITKPRDVFKKKF